MAVISKKATPMGQKRAVKKPSVDPRPAPMGKKRAVKKPNVDPRPKPVARRATPVGKRPPRGPSQDASKLAATMAGRRRRRPATGGTRKRVVGLSDSMNRKLAAQRRRARPASRRRAVPVARPRLRGLGRR